MKLSYYVGRNLNNFIIKFIRDKEFNLDIKLKCVNCGEFKHIIIKKDRVGRINCDKCNNRKIIIINREGKKVINIEIITEHNYNKITKKYNSLVNKDITKYEYIINSLFNNKHLENKEVPFIKINNLFEIEDKVKKDVVNEYKNNKYIMESNGITFSKIMINKDNIVNNIDTEDKTNKMMERLITESNDLQSWCRNNRELGELVIKLYSKRKNNKKLNEIMADSKEEIVFNRGEKRGLFRNTPYDITNNKRIRHKLPNRYSYNKLFILNYFGLLYGVELNKELLGKKVDIFIAELQLAIIYIGTNFNYKRDIEGIVGTLSYNDIRTIIVDGTHSNNNIKIINDIITFKGNNKGKNIDEILYDICTLILKEYDMRSYILPNINDIKHKINLIY